MANLILGILSNSATAETLLKKTGPESRGLSVTNTSERALVGEIDRPVSDAVGVHGVVTNGGGPAEMPSLASGRPIRVGVAGQSDVTSGIGVLGLAGAKDAQAVLGVANLGEGVRGESLTGPGVQGISAAGTGVVGQILVSGPPVSPKRGVAVHAVVSGDVGQAVLAEIAQSSPRAVALQALNPRGWAAQFSGTVLVAGSFMVTGAKNAAVPFPDGSHRLLYSVESPESWFEDFGRAQMVKGRALVRIDAEFAAVIRREQVHVFLNPEGDCQGLYLHRLSAKEFEVREQNSGKSDVTFSYRIVGKRKDIQAQRLAKVDVPKVPEPGAAEAAVRRGGRARRRRGV